MGVFVLWIAVDLAGGAWMTVYRTRLQMRASRGYEGTAYLVNSVPQYILAALLLILGGFFVGAILIPGVLPTDFGGDVLIVVIFLLLGGLPLWLWWVTFLWSRYQIKDGIFEFRSRRKKHRIPISEILSASKGAPPSRLHCQKILLTAINDQQFVLRGDSGFQLKIANAFLTTTVAPSLLGFIQAKVLS